MLLRLQPVPLYADRGPSASRGSKRYYHSGSYQQDDGNDTTQPVIYRGRTGGRILYRLKCRAAKGVTIGHEWIFGVERFSGEGTSRRLHRPWIYESAQ